MTNPEQSVIDAIDGLERDEIGELVDWQLEQGRRSGEYLPPTSGGLHGLFGRWSREPAPLWQVTVGASTPPPVPTARWRTWDENYNLIADDAERPTALTDGHHVTVDHPSGFRQSWRVSAGDLVSEIEYLYPIRTMSNPFLPADPNDPLGSPSLVLDLAPIDTSGFTEQMRRLGFVPGDRVGWEDSDGRVHVETVGTDSATDPVVTAGALLSGLVEFVESFAEDSEADR
jgi:hypothetical protein